MEAIGDLNGFRRAARGALGIEARSISTDHHDSGMRLQPSGQAICGTIGQQINRNMLVEVRPRWCRTFDPLTFAPRPIVDANRHSSVLPVVPDQTLLFAGQYHHWSPCRAVA